MPHPTGRPQGRKEQGADRPDVNVRAHHAKPFGLFSAPEGGFADSARRFTVGRGMVVINKLVVSHEAQRSGVRAGQTALRWRYVPGYEPYGTPLALCA
jgi:hypothetical protein